MLQPIYMYKLALKFFINTIPMCNSTYLTKNYIVYYFHKASIYSVEKKLYIFFAICPGHSSSYCISFNFFGKPVEGSSISSIKA